MSGFVAKFWIPSMPSTCEKCKKWKMIDREGLCICCFEKGKEVKMTKDEIRADNFLKRFSYSKGKRLEKHGVILTNYSTLKEMKEVIKRKLSEMKNVRAEIQKDELELNSYIQEIDNAKH